MNAQLFIDFLRSEFPAVSEIAEAEILNINREIVGWNAYVMCADGSPLSGGTSSDKNQARDKALMEAFERLAFTKVLRDSPLAKQLDVTVKSGTRGFAAGFDEHKVRFRSLCEAVEILVRDHLSAVAFVQEAQPILSPLASSVVDVLQDVEYAHCDISVEGSSLGVRSLRLYVVQSKFQGRVVHGYRVSTEQDLGWEHALVELLRNRGLVEKFNSGRVNELERKLFADVMPSQVLDLRETVAPIAQIVKAQITLQQPIPLLPGLIIVKTQAALMSTYARE